MNMPILTCQIERQVQFSAYFLGHDPGILL